MPPQRVWFLGLFGLKTGMVLEKTVRKPMNVVIVSIPNELERNGKMLIRNAFKEVFCLRSNLSNDYIISA